AFEERGEFALQWFVLFDPDRFADDPATGKFCDDRCVRRDTEDFSEKRTFLFVLARQPQEVALLLLIIEREVSVLLKNANLAQPLLADAARGDVRHATVAETQPHIGDVFAAAEHWHTDRIDTLHRRLY